MKTEVLTLENFQLLYNKLYGNNSMINLENKIKYFLYNDFNNYSASENYKKTLRFIVCYNNYKYDYIFMQEIIDLFCQQPDNVCMK